MLHVIIMSEMHSYSDIKPCDISDHLEVYLWSLVFWFNQHYKGSWLTRCIIVWCYKQSDYKETFKWGLGNRELQTIFNILAQNK